MQSEDKSQVAIDLGLFKKFEIRSVVNLGSMENAIHNLQRYEVYVLWNHGSMCSAEKNPAARILSNRFILS